VGRLLGPSHVIGTMLDRGFVAPLTSTHNIACKPLPYVSASLGLLTLLANHVSQAEQGPVQSQTACLVQLHHLSQQSSW